MTLAILITNDYEVLGNGRGDLESMVIEPTRRVFDICERYSVSHTLFVDIVEYWRFKEAEEQGTFGSSYQFATLIEQQLSYAVSNGHDVQLHAHPQWLTATPRDRHHWHVDDRYWRTSKVPNGLGDRDDRMSLRGLLYQGKRTLENLLRAMTPEYECLAFRAGGYCIQPEAEVLQAMRETGFRVDSSVCPGRMQTRAPAYYDFRAAPREVPYWPISLDVTRPDPAGDLLELPVATADLGIRSLFRRRRAKVDDASPAGNRQTLAKAAIWHRVRQRLSRGQCINVDFCKMSSGELIRATRDRMNTQVSTLPAPMVIMGHSKEWLERANFAAYLDWACKQADISFMTIPQWLALYDAAVDGVKA